MSIMITSEISKQYLLEEDAVEGFRTAVGNGQVRLALQIMTEIVDAFMEMFHAVLIEDEDNLIDSVKQEVEAVSPVVDVKTLEKTVELQEEEKKETNKKTTKAKSEELETNTTE